MAKLNVLRVYPYRTAWVRGNGVVSFPREMMLDFEDYLARIANVKTDNHTCYVVEMPSFRENVIKTFMFTDLYMYMGNTVDVGKW